MPQEADKRLEICQACSCFRRAVDDTVTCTKQLDPVSLVTGHCPMHKWTEEPAKAKPKVRKPSSELVVKSVPKQKKQKDRSTLYNAEWSKLDIRGLFSGWSAFLILGGPSFADLDHDRLKLPGILTMGVNNGPSSFRPNLWTYVDPPCKWLQSIWLDPTIMKFACKRDRDKQIFNSDQWRAADKTVRSCPNVFYYERNADKFCAKDYLYQETFWWGQSSDYTDEFGQRGGRSVMLLAIRLLFYLGIRTVYLLGCDFKMDGENKYHFDQDRTKSSIRGNNATYKKMDKWYSELRPHFDAEDFSVLNCNPESGLKAFDFISYDEAVDHALDDWGNIDVHSERTKGLYEMDKIIVKQTMPLKQATGKASYKATSVGTAKVRSPVTGKVYRAKAHASKKVKCSATGEAKTEIGARVRAEVNAWKKAFFAATEQALKLAQDKAMEQAKKMMEEAERGIAA